MATNTSSYFPKTTTLTYNDEQKLLAFARSLNVSIYPSGRRSSDIVEEDSRTRSDDRYYPFDPEARLNTEFNNRRLASTNGFSQTFIRTWDSDLIQLVLGGYEFSFKSTQDLPSIDVNTFASELAQVLSSNTPESLEALENIYVNIRLEKVPLYSNIAPAENQENQDLIFYTWVLRNQADGDKAKAVSLDKHITLDTSEFEYGTDVFAIENYYFSGLSFSAEPISEIGKRNTVLDAIKDLTYTTTYYSAENLDNSELEQLVISLRILNKDDEGNWQIYQPALLPEIRHGSTAGEVEVGHLTAEGNVKIAGNTQIDRNISVSGNATINGNITANSKDKKAHFYNLEVDNDVQIDGNITANQTGKKAQYYDVIVDHDLEVAGTIDTEKFIASDAQITGDISRLHDGGDTALGLVTMRTIECENRQDEELNNQGERITVEDRPRLAFYTKNSDPGPTKLTRPSLIDQSPNP